MLIRRYREGEEEAIWEIVFQATRVSNARDYHEDLIERWAPLEKDMKEWRARLGVQNPFVAEIDTHLVGLAELEDEGFIEYFYVHPDHQGKGVGKALMETVENEARERGFDRLTANVSVTARTFFEERGFEVRESFHKVILGHPAPNFAMEKILV